MKLLNTKNLLTHTQKYPHQYFSGSSYKQGTNFNDFLPPQNDKNEKQKNKNYLLYISAPTMTSIFLPPLLPEKQLTNKIGERPRVHICTICYVHNFFVPLFVWFHST